MGEHRYERLLLAEPNANALSMSLLAETRKNQSRIYVVKLTNQVFESSCNTSAPVVMWNMTRSRG